MPIFNQPNMAALQAAIVQAVADSQAAVIANTNAKTAAVAQVVVDETTAAETALAAEIAAKATATQNAVSDSASETQSAVNTKAAETQGAVNAKAAETQAVITSKSAIKSVQRGRRVVATNVANITISAVNMTKAFLSVTYRTNGASPSIASVTAVVYLESATSIKVEKTNTDETEISWEVIEYV